MEVYPHAEVKCAGCGFQREVVVTIKLHSITVVLCRSCLVELNHTINLAAEKCKERYGT